MPQQAALSVTTCDKQSPGYVTCLGFVPPCRPSGFACTPGNTTAQAAPLLPSLKLDWYHNVRITLTHRQAIYLTAYPVSVRTVVSPARSPPQPCSAGTVPS